MGRKMQPRCRCVILRPAAVTPLTPPPRQRLQQDLGGLRSDLGDVSRRCLGFFQEKPSSSSVPVLRTQLGLTVEQMDRVHALSSVYLHK